MTYKSVPKEFDRINAPLNPRAATTAFMRGDAFRVTPKPENNRGHERSARTQRGIEITLDILADMRPHDKYAVLKASGVRQQDYNRFLTTLAFHYCVYEDGREIGLLKLGEIA